MINYPCLSSRIPEAALISVLCEAGGILLTHLAGETETKAGFEDRVA